MVNFYRIKIVKDPQGVDEGDKKHMALNITIPDLEDMAHPIVDGDRRYNSPLPSRAGEFPEAWNAARWFYGVLCHLAVWADEMTTSSHWSTLFNKDHQWGARYSDKSLRGHEVRHSSCCSSYMTRITSPDMEFGPPSMTLYVPRNQVRDWTAALQSEIAAYNEMIRAANWMNCPEFW